MRLVILYGSQTGTAQDVAEQIWRESKLYGFVGPVLPLDEYHPVHQLIEERFAIFVVSTTGDGDEPDNMRQTWKFLLRRSLPRDSLQCMQYACLGLGDSSYAKFNYAAKKLNKRLQQLGANELLPIGLCDDQHELGPSAVILPWIKNLWLAISQRIPLPSIDPVRSKPIMKWNLSVLDSTMQQDVARADLKTLQWPYKMEPLEFILKTNQRTTASDHFQDVRFLQFKYAKGVKWNAGDVLEIRPCNSDAVVKKFFELVAEHGLSFSANTIIQLDAIYDDMPVPVAYSKSVSIGELAKYVWDLNCRPRQRVFELLAINCDDEMELEKLIEFTTAEGLEDLISYVNRPRRTLLEVLQDFPHATAKLTLPILCELFPFIQSRSFSIASMPHAAAAAAAANVDGDDTLGTLDMLVAVVEYKTKMSTPRIGLCSNWLKNLPVGSSIFGTIKPGTMSIPAELSTPLIMIGPGTGIAPFRSVIQKRLQDMQQQQQQQQQTGMVTMAKAMAKIVVFFGCRNRSKDFHFEADFQKWQQDNIIKGFFAFSRDQPDKVYVQHLIKENKELLAPLIREENAVILVAGSSNSMPKAVRQAFLDVLNEDENYIEQMIKMRRYQEETWS